MIFSCCLMETRTLLHLLALSLLSDRSGFKLSFRTALRVLEADDELAYLVR